MLISSNSLALQELNNLCDTQLIIGLPVYDLCDAKLIFTSPAGVRSVRRTPHIHSLALQVEITFDVYPITFHSVCRCTIGVVHSS